MIIAGIEKIRENNYLKVYGIKVRGVVYSLKMREEFYYPIVRFRTREDVWITKELGSGSNPTRYREGTHVDLVYDPENPELVELDSYFNLAIVPILVIIIGMALVVYVFLALFDIV